MPTHDFESLGSVLQRLGVAVPPPGEHLPAEPDPDPSCLKCRDVGWVSQDGRAVECFACGVVTTRRMARIWAGSRVPEAMRGYSLESYLERTGDAPLVENIRAVWDATDRWLLFVGPVGLGKTGLAIALLNDHLRTGAAGLYVVTPTFLSRIRATYTRSGDGEVDELDVLASVNEAPLLVLDDLGKTALSPWGQEKLFTLVNERYLNGRRTIVTSNLDLHDTERACKDGCRCLEAHLDPATWDRIRGMSEAFSLSGESLR
jgi:hypothetical protein